MIHTCSCGGRVRSIDTPTRRIVPNVASFKCLKCGRTYTQKLRVKSVPASPLKSVLSDMRLKRGDDRYVHIDKKLYMILRID